MLDIIHANGIMIQLAKALIVRYSFAMSHACIIIMLAHAAFLVVVANFRSILCLYELQS